MANDTTADVHGKIGGANAAVEDNDHWDEVLFGDFSVIYTRRNARIYMHCTRPLAGHRSYSFYVDLYMLKY